MPTNTRLEEELLQKMLEEAGFEDIMLENLSFRIRANVATTLRHYNHAVPTYIASWSRGTVRKHGC